MITSLESPNMELFVSGEKLGGSSPWDQPRPPNWSEVCLLWYIFYWYKYVCLFILKKCNNILIYWWSCLQNSLVDWYGSKTIFICWLIAFWKGSSNFICSLWGMYPVPPFPPWPELVKSFNTPFWFAHVLFITK